MCAAVPIAALPTFIILIVLFLNHEHITITLLMSITRAFDLGERKCNLGMLTCVLLNV